ncbi:MAG: aldo/keto reductase [Chloroflexota bacterium]
MKRRPLGTTGITVGEVGLGAWQLGNPDWGAQAGDAPRIVQAALDAGCDFFDTAPGYGGGRSEEVLGEVLKGVRPHVTICTKFGHTVHGQTNFDAAAMRPALEASLRRLQTEYVDVYLLHNPPSELMDGAAAPHYEELERLKAAGLVRAYGVSVDSRQDLRTVVETTHSGAVEIYFNAFHQEPLAGFARAQARGVGLIVKVPLDSGWLSGKYRGDSQFSGVRSRWTPEVIARRAALVEQFAALVPPGMSLTHAALRYILAQPQVSTIIPGAKTVEQARDNFAAADEELPAGVVQAIHALWQRELQEAPLGW